MLNTGRQVAASVGVAILVAVLGSSTARGVTGFHRAWLAAAVISLAGALACLFLPHPAVRSGAVRTPQVAAERR